MAGGNAEPPWEWSHHAIARSAQRAVPEAQVALALTDPESMWVEPDGSTIYRRGVVQVVVYPPTHTILSCWYRWRGRRWSD